MLGKIFQRNAKKRTFDYFWTIFSKKNPVGNEHLAIRYSTCEFGAHTGQ